MDPSDKSETPPAITSGVRRRLLRGGLSAAPVLMTVASRPVLGQTTCLAASASVGSVPSSGQRTAAATCSGLSPQQWKAQATRWPRPYVGAVPQSGDARALVSQTPTAFHCPTTGLAGYVFSDRSMLAVIEVNEGGQGVTALGRYVVAALLNARAGRTPVLSETTVRAMWNDVINRGYFEPTAGVRWGPTEIVQYIKTTMG
jgi:hypothetical protein